MDRLPAEILLEIVAWLATQPSPSALYTFLAISPAAAFAHAKHPHAINTRIDTRIAALSAELKEATYYGWLMHSPLRWRVTPQAIQLAKRSICAGYIWPSRCGYRYAHSHPTCKENAARLDDLRKKATELSSWERFRTALGDRKALWRMAATGKTWRRRSKRVKRKVMRYGDFA